MTSNFSKPSIKTPQSGEGNSGFIKSLNIQISQIKNELHDLKKNVNDIVSVKGEDKEVIDLSYMENNINEINEKINELFALRNEVNELKNTMSNLGEPRDTELIEYDDKHILGKIEELRTDIDKSINVEVKEYDDTEIIKRIEDISQELEKKANFDDIMSISQAQSPKEKKDDFKIRNDINNVNNKLMELEERLSNNHQMLITNFNAYSDEVINLKKSINEGDKTNINFEEKLNKLEVKINNNSCGDLEYFKKDVERIKDVVFNNNTQDTYQELIKEYTLYQDKHNELDKRLAIVEELIKHKPTLKTPAQPITRPATPQPRAITPKTSPSPSPNRTTISISRK
jgi:DNA repair exonuclease SbcCD ATPase subunit